MKRVGFLFTVLLINSVLAPAAFCACVGDGEGNFICGSSPGSETAPPLSGVTLSQTGPGETVLTGSNNFSSSSSNAASIVITGGILSVTAPASLSGDFQLSLNGGTFKTEGEFSFDNAFNLNGGVLNVSGEESILGLTGPLSGTGVTKEGLGLLEIKSPSSYGGVLTVAEGGVESDSSVLTGDIHLTHADAFVSFREDADNTFSGSADGVGTFIKEGSGVLTVGGRISAHTEIDEGGLSVASSEVLTGDITLNKGSLFVTEDVTLNQTLSFGTENDGVNVSAGKTLTLTGTVAAKGCEGENCSEVIKDGAGTLVMAPTVSGWYFGDTRIKQGVLQLSSGDSLGQAGYAVRIEEGTLSVTDDASIDNQIELLSAASVLDVAEGKTAALQADTLGGGVLRKTGEGMLSLDGGILKHTGGTVIEAGSLRGSGAELAGHIQIANDAALEISQTEDGTLSAALSGEGAVNKTGGGVLTLLSSNPDFGGIFNVSGGAVKGSSQAVSSDVNLATAESRVIFEQNCSGAECEFSKTVSGAGSLVKTGEGLLVLTGNNTYSGGTYVQSASRDSNGILFSSDDALGAASGGVFLSHGNLTLAADTTVSTGRNFTFSELENSLTVSDNSVYTVRGVLGGTSFTKLGGGELVLTGINTHSGGTQITEGMLSVSSSGALGSGILSVTGGLFRPLADMAVNNNVYLNASAGQGGFLVEDGQTLTLNGIVSGGGTLTKKGNGTLELGFYNSYLGGVYAEAGRIRGDTESVLGDVTVLPDAEVEFAQPFDGFYTGNLLSSGSVVKTGQGILYASARDGQNGVLNAGTLRVNEGAFVAQSALDGNVNVAQNAALYLERGGEGVFDVSGNLYLAQEQDADVKGDIIIKDGGSLGFFVEEGKNVQTRVSDTDVPSGKGNITVEEGGKITVNASGVFKNPASFDFLTYTGNLALAGTLEEVDVKVANNKRLAAALTQNGQTLSLVITRLLTHYAADANLTRSQRRVAAALDRASAAPQAALESVLDVLDELPSSARPQALTQLGGFIYANLPNAFNRFKDNAYLRINRAPAEEAYFSRNLWVQAVGDYANVRANENSDELYRLSAGFAVGVDRYFEDYGVTAGFFAGYARQDVKHNKTENLDGDEYQLGAYALKRGDLLDFKGILAAGYHADDVERNLSFIGRRAQTRVKRYGVNAGAELGANLYDTGRFTLRPFAELTGSVTRNSSFAETGADGVNLSAKADTVFFAQGRAGVGVESKSNGFSWYADAGVMRNLNEPEYALRLAGETYRVKRADVGTQAVFNAGGVKRYTEALSVYGNIGAAVNDTAQNYYVNIGLRSYW